MANYSINVVLRTEKLDNQGRAPIYLRISINRKHTYKSIGFKVAPEYWNATTKEVTKKVPNHVLINSVIRKVQIEAQTKLLEQQMITGEELNQTAVKRITQGDTDGDLIKYMEAWLNHIEQNKTRAPETIRHMKGDLKKWKYYTGGSIHFSRVTVKYLEEFKSWLMNNMGLANNTAWRVLKFIRTAFNAAIKEGVTKHYPFKHYNLVYEEKLKGWLEREEVEAIWEAAQRENMAPSYKLVAYYFLLGCYSGLRFSDLQRVHTGELVKGNRLVCATTKTGEIVSIPLTSKLRELLDYIGNKPLIANTHANVYIKEIAKAAKLKEPKRVHFHLARHTFATLSLELGIPISTVQAILGHRNIRTTAIYAKVSNPLLNEAMDKWENLQKIA